MFVVEASELEVAYLLLEMVVLDYNVVDACLFKKNFQVNSEKINFLINYLFLRIFKKNYKFKVHRV